MSSLRVCSWWAGRICVYAEPRWQSECSEGRGRESGEEPQQQQSAERRTSGHLPPRNSVEDMEVQHRAAANDPHGAAPPHACERGGGASWGMLDSDERGVAGGVSGGVADVGPGFCVLPSIS